MRRTRSHFGEDWKAGYHGQWDKLEELEKEEPRRNCKGQGLA